MNSCNARPGKVRFQPLGTPGRHGCPGPSPGCTKSDAGAQSVPALYRPAADYKPCDHHRWSNKESCRNPRKSPGRGVSRFRPSSTCRDSSRVISKTPVYISAMTTVVDSVSRHGIRKRPTVRTTISSASRTGSGSRRQSRRNMPPPAKSCAPTNCTPCAKTACPNISECWTKRHATMMIMGDTCTRACAFCNKKTRLQAALDAEEPANVARAVKTLGLMHVVITSVDHRNDLDDGGAQRFAKVIHAMHSESPGTSVEVLTPDSLHQGRRHQNRDDGPAGSLQAQSGNRATALPQHPPGRAI